MTPSPRDRTKSLVTSDAPVRRIERKGFSNVPRKTSQTLTEAEIRIMQVLWLKGPGTVQHILDALPANPALAYNTVLTTIRILERKGYIGHDKDGRAHIFRALDRRRRSQPLRDSPSRQPLLPQLPRRSGAQYPRGPRNRLPPSSTACAKCWSAILEATRDDDLLAAGR
jgi:hypothetical protein